MDSGRKNNPVADPWGPTIWALERTLAPTLEMESSKHGVKCTGGNSSGERERERVLCENRLTSALHKTRQSEVTIKCNWMKRSKLCKLHLRVIGMASVSSVCVWPEERIFGRKFARSEMPNCSRSNKSKLPRGCLSREREWRKYLNVKWFSGCLVSLLVGGKGNTLTDGWMKCELQKIHRKGKVTE